MRHCDQAEDEVLQQVLALEDGPPKSRDIRVAMKAARRVRHNARKLSAKRYDGLPV